MPSSNRPPPRGSSCALSLLVLLCDTIRTRRPSACHSHGSRNDNTHKAPRTRPGRYRRCRAAAAFERRERPRLRGLRDSMSSPTTSCISACSTLADNAPGRLLRLFDGELPAAKAARKKQKPDLEAITQLPPFGNYPHGALLALGSGSKQNRRRGALLRLDAAAPSTARRACSMSRALFEELDRRFPALNIEGAVAIGDELRLLQRAQQEASAECHRALSVVRDSRRARDRRGDRRDRAIGDRRRSTSARSTASP